MAQDADGYPVHRTHADGYRAARHIPEPWEPAETPDLARETNRAAGGLILALAAFVALLAVGAALT